MHQAGAFLNTQLKAGMQARRVYSAPADSASGVIWGQRTSHGGFGADKNYAEAHGQFYARSHVVQQLVETR